jgi:hypothetical protein
MQHSKKGHGDAVSLRFLGTITQLLTHLKKSFDHIQRLFKPLRAADARTHLTGAYPS